MRNDLALLLSMVLLSTLAWADPLSTVAERSNYSRTGRYQEVPKLCQAFVTRWPQWVRVETFGQTPEGRPMLALVVSKSGTLEPESVREEELPVLLIQGGIHAGEIDGKDAGFWALRDLLNSDDAALQNLVIVFVPIFNVDGHERFGPWNRPNQTGPEEIGWRVTSQNLNLNRDYAKADTPEMEAMLGLLQRWDPILYVDLHATDGAQFQPDVAILVEPLFSGDPHLKPVGQALQAETLARLGEQGSMPLPFYPSFREHDNPESGFANGAFTPRFSTGYWALRNRLTLLVETHSWKDYPTRVRVTRNTLMALVKATSRQGEDWSKAAAEADRRSAQLGGKPVTLRFKTSDKKSTLNFPGYAYRRFASEVSGAQALVYDPSTPQTWEIPFYEEVVPELVVTAPGGGYLVPPAHARWLEKRLALHDIETRWLKNEIAEATFEVFRAKEVRFSSRPLEGRQTASMAGQWSQEEHALPKGCLFVPIAQPKARLVMALLEPLAPDSYASWGFFNAHFEQKEYMEGYVAEQIGKKMLATDPQLAAEFARRLETEPKFAQDSAARLDFFYRRHSSWDRRKNLYPVMRTERIPETG